MIEYQPAQIDPTANNLPFIASGDSLFGESWTATLRSEPGNRPLQEK